ncbi:hypothetical protein L202_03476 [Cryptococcus amylolentus CBS 6039]|uniref:Zn(2)-C6 fungal-type domain-containing protein n=2 Tax=Cryptococcus amylolentus TaxID=104669 RepID=A0A1E3HT32_9TREE|nr:hypothetical protein L202_03476 [Cryptococcus amylolentus CBS 6039]ODN79510.1 hypothetical protein L202_03476 [Cryptococcus amylolentus CBS 6039]ODO07856.1 hypothetical protein I350_03436 [Cryptococcus amylolentus CBS 6273]
MSSNGSFSYHPGHEDPSPGHGLHISHRESIVDFHGQSPASTARKSSSKHQNPADHDGEGDDQPQKKKKRRVALSCAECAKRKQKCNRETPCQHCVARRVPELCVPYSRADSPSKGTKAGSGKKDKDGPKVKTEEGRAIVPDKMKPSMLPTISVRVGRLEALVNAMVNRVPEVNDTKAYSDWRINHPPADSPPVLGAGLDDEEDEQDEDVEGSPRPETRGGDIERPATASSVRSRRDEHSAEWGANSEGEDGGVGGLDRATSSRNPLPQSMMHSSQPVYRGLDYHGTPGEQLQKLFGDCGVSPEKVSDLMKDLPAKDFADALVDWFFQKFNFVRYPIDDHAFRKALESVYNDGTSPSAVLALPLVFIVLSISMRIAPDALIESEEKKRTMSLKMYWSSKSAVIIASAVKAENIQLVETRICTGLYLVLMHERRLAEGWSEFRSALTTGQAIGLHRDGKRLGLDPYVTEYRRRLWSYLVHADATYSCLLGRPTSIDEESVDTLPPSNTDLPDILENKAIKPKPWSEPTYSTYLILRRGLGQIVAKITKQFQHLQGQTGYKDVEAIDAELKELVASMPPSFAMHNPDKSWDDKLWFLSIHRYYIQTEILHFTIILHRPWLLRRLRSSRYVLSRNACFEAATTDYKIRQAFKIDCPDFFETLLGSSFREFRSSHTNDMRQIVQSFMEHYPHDPKADDFSQKEAAIIHTLHQRAVEMEERRLRRYQPRLSTDNTSYERGSPRDPRPPMAPPLAPTSSHDGGENGRSDRSRNAPLPSPSGSAQAHFRGSPYGAGVGPTPPSMGASPEDDHPQRLLDHWLVTNQSFGPGADSTMNQYNMSLYPTPVGAVGGGGIPVDPVFQDPSGGQSVSHMEQVAGSMPMQPQPQYSQQGQSGWLDPSLFSATPVASLQAPAVINGMPPGFGAVEGNNTQYWNMLIDGIVGGLPTYDPNFPAVQ